MPFRAGTESTNRVKRHRHGYRGYGSPLRQENTGQIHWGRGFGGVGAPEGAAILPPHPDLIPEELRERLPAEHGDKDRSH